jgi:hypothetical protein
MPWSQTMPRDQRVQFIADYLRNTLSMTELCDLYRVSRKTSVTSVAAPSAWRNSHANHASHQIKPQLGWWRRASRIAATLSAGV